MRRRAAARRLPAAAVLAVAVAWAMPAASSAHAVLQHTEPHQNGSVSAAPSSVRLGFNEPVEVSFGAVRIYDQRGGRVDTGDVSYPAGKQDSVVVGVRGGLGRGIYTTTYRVISADGHPVSGGFAFGVGEAVTAQRGTPQVADLLAKSSAGPVVEGAYGTVRGLHYIALLLLVGAVFFRLLAWPSQTTRRWPTRGLGFVAIGGLLCALAGVALQGALGAGASLGHLFDGTVLRGSLDTRTGAAWLARAIAWAVVAVVLLALPRLRPRAQLLAIAIPGLVIVGSLPYAGHANSQSPKAVLIPADVLHILATGAWLGGLVLLLISFWPGRSAEPTDGAAEATARFSRMALPAVVLIVAAGATQAWFYLGSVGAFFDSTYGWALVAKIVLLAIVIALASRNRRDTSHLTTGAQATAGSLRRSMRAEVVLAVAVLAATATLVRAAPPETLNSGPVLRELDLGPMRLQMDIEPADVGPNDYHLYLFDRRTGAQIDRVKQLTVKLVQRDKGIGPITLDIPREGAAHYELRNATLGVAGTWDASVTARVDEFDEYTAKTTFKVRP